MDRKPDIRYYKPKREDNESKIEANVSYYKEKIEIILKNVGKNVINDIQIEEKVQNEVGMVLFNKSESNICSEIVGGVIKINITEKLYPEEEGRVEIVFK